MSISTEAMKNPNKLANKEFIEKALDELSEDMKYIEEKFDTVLIGDRFHFNNARVDWLSLTQMQVVSVVSKWKKTIFDRYGITKK